MNYEKVKYLFSMSDNVIEGFKGMFSVFSSGKKGFLLYFLILGGVCPLRDCLVSKLLSFRRIGIS